MEDTPPLNSMTSMALLFSTSVFIENIVAAPNKHTWVKLYKVLAVLDKASRLEVLLVLRFDRWRIHAHLSSGLFEPLVQRSTLDVPPIPTLHVQVENGFSVEDNSISWKSVEVEVVGRRRVELQVSDAFRWPDDTETCDETDDYDSDGDGLGTYWHDSFRSHGKFLNLLPMHEDSVFTLGPHGVFTETHVIVVQISAQMPHLVQVSMMDIVHDIPTGLEGGLRYVPGQPVDVCALPMVFRAAMGLETRGIASVDYPAERMFSYRRYVKALPTSTVREVWNAVANVEGWETSCEGTFDWHFPNLAPDETVSQYFDAMEPPQDDPLVYWLTQGEANVEWQRDGRRTLHLSWAGSNFRHMHSALHPHYAGVTGV